MPTETVSNCEQRREQDDHLSLVANVTRLQTTRLNDHGIPTLRALAAAAPDQKPPKMQQSTFDKLRRQARLQVEQRTAIARGDAQPYRYEFLESGIRANGIADDDAQRRSVRGFYRLPEPSPGRNFTKSKTMSVPIFIPERRPARSSRLRTAKSTADSCSSVDRA